MTSSNGFNDSPNDDIVRIKYVSFPLKPPTNAAYADCGSDSAIFDHSLSCIIHSSTKDCEYDFLNDLLPITAPRCLLP